jgi:hypothetical protein
MTCTSSPYVVTQADVDAGSVANSATATGTPPTGPAVVSPPSQTSTPTPSTPALTLVKTAELHDTNGNHRADRGEVIDYGFHVVNTGDVTVQRVSVVDQTLARLGIAITCPKATLAPAEEMDCRSGSYTVTQADVNAGQVRNVATANGVTPAVGTHPSAKVVSKPSTAVVTTGAPSPGAPSTGAPSPDASSPGSGGHGPLSGLAFTGANIVPLAGGGLALLLAGVGLAWGARRRSQASTRDAA